MMDSFPEPSVGETIASNNDNEIILIFSICLNYMIVSEPGLNNKPNET